MRRRRPAPGRPPPRCGRGRATAGASRARLRTRGRPPPPRPAPASRTRARTRGTCTRRSALFASALHVALHELLGVLLEDVVDLVEQIVEVFLELLALLGELTASRPGLVALRRLLRPRLLLLLLCHGRSSWPLPGEAAGPRRWGARSPAGPGTSPAGPRRTSGRPRRIRRTAPARCPRWRRSSRAAAWCC